MKLEEIKSKIKEKGMDFIILKTDKIISVNLLKNNVSVKILENEEDLLSYLNG